MTNAFTAKFSLLDTKEDRRKFGNRTVKKGTMPPIVLPGSAKALPPKWMNGEKK